MGTNSRGVLPDVGLRPRSRQRVSAVQRCSTIGAVTDGTSNATGYETVGVVARSFSRRGAFADWRGDDSFLHRCVWLSIVPSASSHSPGTLHASPWLRLAGRRNARASPYQAGCSLLPYRAVHHGEPPATNMWPTGTPGVTRRWSDLGTHRIRHRLRMALH